MSHVVIVNHNAGSPEHGPNFRSYYAARGWVERGLKATIVCSAFSHKLKKLPPITAEELSEEIDGIRYMWLKTRAFRGNVGRLRNFFEFSRQLRRLDALIPEPVDHVVCSSPPPFWIWQCEGFARRKGASLIFEARDLWPDVIFETSRTGRVNPAAWLMWLGERRAYQRADAIVSVNESAIKVIGKRGLDEERFWPIPNGTTTDMSGHGRPTTAAAELCRRLRAEGQFVVGYSGALSRIYGLEYLAEAARECAGEQVSFVLAGTGPLEQRFEKLSRDNPHVHLAGWVPKEDLQAFLEEVDICYAGLLNVRSFVYGSDSTKLYEYMKAGRPILHGIGDEDCVVVRAGCGLRVVPESAAALVAGIRQFQEMGPERRAELGAIARRFVAQERSYSILTECWLELFAALGGRRAGAA
jgi:glycosyltransferase involved in cell wall biosynthesis